MTAWRAALAAVAIALAAPAYAGAHAGFVSSTPANDAVVEVAPKQVVLRFNQAVKASSVRLFDGVGRPVPVGKLSQPQPSEVVAPIEATLERDSYTVAWRVISDDVDPVSGFLVFHVGVQRAPAAARRRRRGGRRGVGVVRPVRAGAGVRRRRGGAAARAPVPARRRWRARSPWRRWSWA